MACGHRHRHRHDRRAPNSASLQLEDKAGNAAFTLRKLYEKLLRPFDDHCKARAEGGYGLLGEPTQPTPSKLAARRRWAAAGRRISVLSPCTGVGAAVLDKQHTVAAKRNAGRDAPAMSSPYVFLDRCFAAAAQEAEASEAKLDPLEDAGMDEDEAAEILSAMLGLAPPEPKKRRKSGAKVRSIITAAPISLQCQAATLCWRCFARRRLCNLGCWG